jgi:aryl-alcohol dehydrogenase-like predicted oxidoreductase
MADRIPVMEPTLSRIGLGCSRFGSFGDAQPLRASEALVRAALDMGVTLFDTADIYGQGDSERVLGRALAGQRDRAFLVTKTGQTFSAKMRLLRPLKPILRPLLKGRGGAVTAQRGQAMQADWRPQTFARRLEASLRRLRTDHVDGFLLHGPPAEAIAMPAVSAALGAVKNAGKVRHFGVSCETEADLDAALAMPGLSLLELPPALLSRAADAAARGIIVLAREVISLRPSLDPVEAVRAAAGTGGVASSIVRTSKAAHLHQIVEGLGA